MQHKGWIVRTSEEFNEFASLVSPTALVAADVETYKQRPSQTDARLLGLALTSQTQSGEYVSAYITLTHYDKLTKQFIVHEFENAYYLIGKFLTLHRLIGWNVPFDKAWLDECFDIRTRWEGDGRILWHLQNNDFTIRGFGLKLAQKKLLGWEEGNDKALEENVALSGGKLSNGDHYLADLDILSHYACLDTFSTLKCYEILAPWMDKYDYWDFSQQILQYSIRLHEASSNGLPTDEADLLRAQALYKQLRIESEAKLRSVCAPEIKAIEESWKVKRAAAYIRVPNREAYLESPERWRVFNPSSGPQRALLIHTLLGYPINETTPTGRAKTDRANLTIVPHEGAKALVSYSEAKKIVEQSQTYLDHIEENRMHTNYDVCGTVSGRLSGFSPSVLNMPFSEVDVMRAFQVEPGYVGIHADLAAIEPCVLAHYSEDLGLLKVYREGRGDIYLDLALEVFPDREDLRAAYNPMVAPSSAIKEQFKDLRAICKILHLAVSYTGTHITVSKNLTKAGYLTTKGKAMQLVKQYWQKFSRVKAFNYRLQEIYNDKGHIRNLVGRIIQVPDIYKKDLMNRLVQSSAHDILMLWVMEIIRLFNEREIEWQYWLPDIHDSTTFMVCIGSEEMARQVYLDALQSVASQVRMSVPIKCEIKFCRTLAGLKTKE